MDTDERRSEQGFAEWAIVEIMGHVRLAGRVTEQAIGGQPFIRVDVPGPLDTIRLTRFYGAQAIYSITPVSEQVARLAAQRAGQLPVQRWELPAHVQQAIEEREQANRDKNQAEVDDELDEEALNDPGDGPDEDDDF